MEDPPTDLGQGGSCTHVAIVPTPPTGQVLHVMFLNRNVVGIEDQLRSQTVLLVSSLGTTILMVGILNHNVDSATNEFHQPLIAIHPWLQVAHSTSE